MGDLVYLSLWVLNTDRHTGLLLEIKAVVSWFILPCMILMQRKPEPLSGSLGYQCWRNFVLKSPLMTEDMCKRWWALMFLSWSARKREAASISASMGVNSAAFGFKAGGAEMLSLELAGASSALVVERDASIILTFEFWNTLGQLNQNVRPKIIYLLNLLFIVSTDQVSGILDKWVGFIIKIKTVSSHIIVFWVKVQLCFGKGSSANTWIYYEWKIM